MSERNYVYMLRRIRETRVFSWYRQLRPRHKLVMQASTAVTFWQVIANVLFFTYPRWSLTIIEWNGVAFGMITSVAAVYYALYVYWHSEKMIETAVETGKQEIYDRLGLSFIKSLVEFGRNVNNRWSQLTPEQQASILSRTETIIDKVFTSLSKETPKPERKKVKTMRV
jgi:hypothetical protein